jgi:hypothetical protein
MFNLNIQTFRMELFWVQVCPELLDPQALSEFGRQMLDRGSYQSAGGETSSISLSPMGRRFRRPHMAQGTVRKPHQFWASYYANVSPPERQWFGLAPFRVQFRQHKLLRVNQAFVSGLRLPGLTRASVFPSAYLCPVGWSVGLTIDLEGNLAFSDVAASSTWLTSQSHKPFLCYGQPASSEFALRTMSTTIRRSLVRGDGSYVHFWPYLVASPIVYLDQPKHFLSLSKNEIQAILGLLIRRPTSTSRPYASMFDANSFSMTVFNYGTFLLTANRGRVASCWLSNLKNAIMMATLIEAFLRSTRFDEHPQVTQMRSELVSTLHSLLKAYDTPHFGKICRQHSAIRGILQPRRDTSYDRHLVVESNRLASLLTSLEPGRTNWGQYQALVADIFPFLFEEEWVLQDTQVTTIDGVDRMDIVALIEADQGFWARINHAYGPVVTIEAKNSKKVTKADFEQLSTYLNDKGRGFGMLVKRGIVTPEEQRLTHRFCSRDTFILVLGDADVLEMLERRKEGESPKLRVRDAYFDIMKRAPGSRR